MGPLHPSLALPPPLVVGISPLTAHALAFLFTTSYVGSLYLSQTLFTRRTPPSTPKGNGNGNSHSQPSIPPISATDQDAVPELDSDAPKPGSRDHPDTIRLRMKAVGTATVLSVAGVLWVIKDTGGCTLGSAIHPTLALLGIPTALSLPTAQSATHYALAPTLLLGPLYATYLDECLPLQRYGFSPSNFGFGLIELRNYLIGPLTEEIVFRSTILSVSILGGLSPRALVFGTPLWFGTAHAHHAWEVYRQLGRTREAALRALGGCLFQLSYTTLFGWFASYLFIRTGSVIPPLISHIFCNIMGIYLPQNAVSRHPSRRLAIWGAYLAGIAGFIYGLRLL